MKFEELEVEQLKRELSKLELPMAGNKAELQRTLIDEFKRRDIDIGTYEFEDKEEMEVCTRATTSNMDVITMFAAFMEKMDKLQESFNEKFLAQVEAIQESSRATNEKLLECFKVNNENLLEMRQSFKVNNEKLLDDVKVKIQESSRATNEKLDEWLKVSKQKLQESFRVNQKLLEVQEGFEDNNEELLGQETKLVTIEHQKVPPQSETVVWAHMEGDCKENSLCVVEPSEIKGDLITAKALVKPCNDEIVPERMQNLSSYEKVVRPNSGISECASADAEMNFEEDSEPENNMPGFLLACGPAVHSFTSRTPAKVVLGTKLRLPGGLECDVGSSSDKGSEGVSQEQDDLSKIYECMRRQIEMTCDRVKARHYQTVNCEKFKEGQLLLLVLCGLQRREDLSPKLQPHWDGPYLVNKESNDVVCRKRRCKRPRCKMKVVHLSRLAAYGRGESVPIRDEQA